jgi:hypothetical protein
MRFHIHQPPGSRNGRVVRHAFIQRDAHERSDRQAVAGAPGDASFRIDPFEIAHHQQPEINPWRQTRPADFAGVEILADGFDVLVELLLIQDLIQPLIKRVARAHR